MNNDCVDRKGIDRREMLLSGSSLLAASALIGEVLVTATSEPASAQASTAIPATLPADQIGDVATSAYIYAYPLIMMEITRRVTTNVADTSHIGKTPMNQLGDLPGISRCHIHRCRAAECRHTLFFHVVRRVERTAADQCA